MGPTLAKVDPLVVKLSRRVFGRSLASNHVEIFKMGVQKQVIFELLRG
jgi:hypothetical protein